MIPIRIINYHAVKNSIPLEQSRQIFFRLEIFLKNASESLESTPMLDVDEAWHTFILHTRLYHDYCVENFNQFIHHNPHPVNFFNTCDTGGQQRAKCNKEEEDKCEAGLAISSFAPCDDGSETGKCDAQLYETLTVTVNQHV